MPRAPHFVSHVAPLLPILAGIALSVWRFRDGDPLTGLAFGLAGVVGMVILATLVVDRK